MRIRTLSIALLLSAGTLFAQQATQPTPISNRTQVWMANSASGGAPSAPPAPRSFDLSAIDKSANPCVDFYQFACGN